LRLPHKHSRLVSARRFALKRFALAPLLVLLCAGQAEAQPPRPVEDFICPGIYKPVCARKVGRDACWAASDRYRVVAQGDCATTKRRKPAK
jgi:hypothetical protein